MDHIGLPNKILTPDPSSKADRRLVYMDIDKEEEGVDPYGVGKVPATERVKATPLRRLPSTGRRKTSGKKVDKSQRLISAMFFKDITGIKKTE